MATTSLAGILARRSILTIRPKGPQAKYKDTGLGRYAWFTRLWSHLKPFTTCLRAGLYVMVKRMTLFMTLRVHVRANMGSCEWAVMGLESLAVSVPVSKHFVTILSKTYNNLQLKTCFS